MELDITYKRLEKSNRLDHSMLEQPLGIPMGTSANTILRETTRRIILNLISAWTVVSYNLKLVCFCMTHDVYGGFTNKIYLTQALVCESSDFG